MEGTNPVNRSIAAPSYLPGNGNAGILGGGTYTGNSLEPQLGDWENIFGPAGRDVRVDQQRHKRHQRWHLPDVLKGPNTFLTDRVDGLITDTTNSPFTTIILPYKYIENPDAKIKWNSFSFDEGLASRVPYESAARVLTQTKRSYAAYAVRHGLAIEMEHNFMMSPKGMENFQNQVKQLVGSIQQSNDLDVHIALVQAPSYAKEYAEKYSGTDKTPYQVCREYVDLFGIVQKNPNALDILIEEAKIQLRLWGSPEPTFLMCNSKLTFQLQMTPDRTNYITNGIDGVKRLRQGPDIAQYRGLSIVNSRAYSMETGAPPRDVLRRRVRVGEYYRIPPQADRNWEVELYDESRDTWFKLSPDDLDRYADLSGQGGTGNNFVQQPDARLTWDEFIGGTFYVDMNVFQLKMTSDPDKSQTTVIMPRIMKPRDGLGWDASMRHIRTMHQGVFDNAHTKDDYHPIIQELNRGNLFVPQPNHTNFVYEHFPAEVRNIPFWLFMHTAFLNNTCHLLWTQVNNMDRQIVREKIIPFVYGVNHQAVLAEYNGIDDDARINIYHSLMFLGCPMRFHPDDTIRAFLEKKFAERGLSMHTLRATLTHFVRRCLDDATEEIPNTRIKLGKRLDDSFRVARFPQADQSRSIYNRWPPTAPGQRPIAVAAGVAENVGSLDDYRIEEYYSHHRTDYDWNSMPEIEKGHEDTVHEGTTLDSFLYAATLRMMTAPDDDRSMPDFWPVLNVKGSNESVEYVIVRPVIEHNMLGVIMGRGGSDELGNTLWGQTELSCYDDSFHGVWGMS
jgi:hypothetical protein